MATDDNDDDDPWNGVYLYVALEILNNSTAMPEASFYLPRLYSAVRNRPFPSQTFPVN